MTADPTRAELDREGALEGLALPRGARLERLTGHASTRRFFRVRAAGGLGILAVYPVAERDGVRRYLRTAVFFEAAGVRVPRVLGAGAHAVLVEDGGDELLDRGAPELQERLYRQAVRTLVALQRHGDRQRLPGGLLGGPNPEMCLDASRLRLELDFMEEHALRGWLGAGDDDGARSRAYDRLVSEIERQPLVLCHRDYHARNLLVTGDRLMVLDFQDVMLGPLFYDIASLIWDNYRDVEPVVASATLAAFWDARRCRLEVAAAAEIPLLPAGLPPAARQAFCLVSVQRCLKALGTFGYQVTVAGNSEYARYAPRTWRHARTALEALGWDDLLRKLHGFERLSA